MVAALAQWEFSLPPFLKPRPTSSLGTQTWERQNSVLGLALAHSRILATRRCLPVDASGFSPGSNTARQHSDNMRICLSSICEIIDRVYPMITHGKLLWGFWLTQYIAMCAISTLFVYKIQKRRGSVSTSATTALKHPQDDQDLTNRFQKAEEVQEYLSKIAPAGSQAKRHHNLLTRLRQRANKSVNSAGRDRHWQQNQKPQGTDADYAEQQAPQSPLDMMQQQSQGYEMGYSTSEQLPPLSASEGSFTPGMMFDFAFPDASSWQYLDQLGSVPLQLDYAGDGGVATWSI